MSITLKQIFYALTFNSCLFLSLIIGIQNSSNRSRVNLLINKTVPLPISFIIGLSFISGSLTGSVVAINLTKKIYSPKEQ